MDVILPFKIKNEKKYFDCAFKMGIDEMSAVSRKMGECMHTPSGIGITCKKNQTYQGLQLINIIFAAQISLYHTIEWSRYISQNGRRTSKYGTLFVGNMRGLQVETEGGWMGAAGGDGDNTEVLGTMESGCMV